MEEQVARAYAILASMALVHRRLDLLHGWCEEGIVHCEARDQDMFVALLRVRAAYGLMEQCEWEASANELQRLATLPAVTARELEQARHVRALIGLRRGDPAEEGYWTDMLDGRHRLSADPWYAPQAVARTEAAWLRGEPELVVRIASEALPAAVRAGERWRTGQLACWLARVGRLPDGFDAPVSPPSAAELAGDARGAARAWVALGYRYDEALALLCGSTDEQREAIALLDAIGAAPAARVARRRLRDHGVDKVGRGPYRHARDDRSGLTGREREVMELLRQGLSNAAIAVRLHRSERTVEHHVAAVLRKLGVASRSAVAALDRPP